jgi:hypothetical protein
MERQLLRRRPVFVYYFLRKRRPRGAGKEADLGDKDMRRAPVGERVALSTIKRTRRRALLFCLAGAALLMAANKSALADD